MTTAGAAGLNPFLRCLPFSQVAVVAGYEGLNARSRRGDAPVNRKPF